MMTTETSTSSSTTSSPSLSIKSGGVVGLRLGSNPSPKPLAPPPSIGRTVSPRGSNASISSTASTNSLSSMQPYQQQQHQQQQVSQQQQQVMQVEQPPPASISSSLGDFMESKSSSGAAAIAASVCTPGGNSSKMSGSEKTGRWTEEEHEVFLRGLEKHGKQWKLIAGMIGTRTVVQVRTHAQKYFQKLERKNNPVPAAPNASASPTDSADSIDGSLLDLRVELSSPPQKRKSISSALASPSPRKKQAISNNNNNKPSTASPSPRKPRISISLSNIAPSPHPDTERISSPPLMLYPSSSVENLSNISPSGVADIDLSVSYAESLYPAPSQVADHKSFPASSSYHPAPATAAMETYEDPLDWFDSDESMMEQLPESSLPAFPDFNNLIAPSLEAGVPSSAPIYLQPQCSSAGNASGPPSSMDYSYNYYQPSSTYDYPTTSAQTTSHHHARHVSSVQRHHHVPAPNHDAFLPTTSHEDDDEDDDDILPSFIIEDPKITAQTLLDDAEDLF